MVSSLKAEGVEVVVSVWPTVARDEPLYPQMLLENRLVRANYGECVVGFEKFDPLTGSAACVIDPFGATFYIYFPNYFILKSSKRRQNNMTYMH